MNKKTSHAKGVEAEKRAVAQLKRSGYKILQERYKTKYGEIDIIAQKKNLIAFIEVKAHKMKDASLYAVTPKAQKRIGQSALWFISEFPDYAAYQMRFDVMVFSGDWENKNISAEHLDNAWMLEA